MAKYRTDTTELTSIADAIRAKTGSNSSLVYPTGFVSAINGITTAAEVPFNPLGKNLELINTVYENTLTLANTSFNASSVTTSNSTIYSQQTLTSIDLSASYDYTEVAMAYVLYQYTETPTQTAFPTEAYWICLYPFGRKPSEPSSIVNNSFDYIQYGPGASQLTTLYYNASGTYALTINAYGINFGLNPASFTNRTSATFGCTLYTPIIRINYNDNYISTNSINALDTANTIIYMKLDLYRSNQGNLFNWINQKTIDLYQQVHST